MKIFSDMKKKLTQQEKKLYRQMDEIIHYMWDPIGVAGEPGARDEYHSYLPIIFRHVLENLPIEKVAIHLADIEEGLMGSSPNKKKALKIAGILHKTKIAIIDEGT